MKVLFVLKDRFYNRFHSESYGLINSSKQVADFLESIGHECKIVQVIDGNGIDKELFLYRPDVVIIEALWVTAAKMKELIELKRYAKIKWVVRIHSDAGFLAAEGTAFKYINDYIELHKDNLYVSMNNLQFNHYTSQAMYYDFTYLPNIITLLNYRKPPRHKHEYIDIGCFGSLRILKNHVYQALCAIDAANRLRKTLRFHITVDPDVDEKTTNPVYKNLEEIFKDSRHELVKHYWLTNDKFHELIKEMDIGMQISYTESFNIVTADFVNNDTPIVVSDAIRWMPFIMRTSSVEYRKTVRKIIWAYRFRRNKLITRWSKLNLAVYNEEAKLEWRKFMNMLQS